MSFAYQKLKIALSTVLMLIITKRMIGTKRLINLYMMMIMKKAKVILLRFPKKDCDRLSVKSCALINGKKFPSLLLFAAQHII